MSNVKHKPEVSDAILEIGAKVFPRRYHRFRDLRPYQEAREWSRTLDWRGNPYDRFLLHREILRHLEATSVYEPGRNIYSFASREEIKGELDRLMAEFPEEQEGLGVFAYVLLTIPWRLGFRHGRVESSRLAAALASLSPKLQGQSGA